MTTTQTVYFRGGRREAVRIIRAMVGSLTGQSQRDPENARGVFLALGFAALSDIAGDFVRKSRGEIGEDGNQWPPLSKEYLAYSRRFGPGEQAALKRGAGLGPGHRFAPGGRYTQEASVSSTGSPRSFIPNTGLLNKSQMTRWRKLYSQSFARFAASIPIPQAKARAAQVAWATLKKEGAQTKLEVYGNREVDILRDTGVLLNSLSMGELGSDGVTYTAPTLPGGEQQIFETLSNGVIVGTRVPYAHVHNEGHKAKPTMPERRFIPKSDNVPSVWLRRWLQTGMTAVGHAIARSLAQGIR